MNARGYADEHWRDVFAIMPGDRVRDGAGKWWGVRSVAHEWIGTPDAPRLIRLVLTGEGGQPWPMVIRIDPAGAVPQVPMVEGPGWDLSAVRSDGPEAMGWAAGMVADVLGGAEAGG